MSRGGFAIADLTDELGFENLAESERTVAKLLELHLVQPCPSRDGWFVPVDPGVISSQLLMRSELELLERQLQLARLREDLSRLSLLFGSSRFGSAGSNSFDTVEASETVGLLLSEAAANSSYEVLSMQPKSGWPTEESTEAQTRDFQILNRGVSMRVLYQHAARFDTPAREHAEKLSGAGAEIRTAGALFGTMFIFDRTTAYIQASQEDRGAVIVKERALVDFLYSCFEHVWATAKEFDTRRFETDAISDDMKREIVKLLISGAKDEAIARRLGVSVRTCRKHIGQVMQMFGATSRFQFGYLVREANLAEDV